MDALSTRTRVLLLENSALDAKLIERALKKGGLMFVSQRAATRETYAEALRTFTPDVVLAAHNLPDIDSLTAIEMARQHSAELPVIIVSGMLTDVAAANLMKAGACDYILKDRLARLGASVPRAIAERDASRARREAEASLRASEAKFRALVESSRDVIWEIDRNGLFTYVSPHVSDLLGYEPDELIGRSPLELVPQDGRELWRSGAEGAFVDARGPLHIVESSKQHKDGRRIFVESNAVAFFDDHGHLAGYRGITLDISVRKQLFAEREKLARIVDSSHDAIMAKDLNNNITSWNRGAERIFGYSAAEAIGNHVSFLAPDHLKSESEGLTAKMMDGEVIENHATVRQRKDRTLVDVLMTYSPIRDVTGAIIGAAGVAKDVTRQKEAERALSAERAMLRTEHELSPDGILMVDAKGMISSYNQQFLDLWNVSNQETSSGIDSVLLESAAKLTVNPEDFYARVKYFYDHPDEKGLDEIDFKDGRILQRYTAAARDAHGTYIGRVWYFRDITGQKRATESLQQEREKFQTIFETAVDGIFLSEADTQIIMEVNTAGHRIFGYPPGDLIGRSIANISAGDPNLIRQNIAAAMDQGKGGAPQVLEWECKRKNGEIFWAEVTMRFAQYGSRQVNVAIVRDITVRRKANFEIHEKTRQLARGIESTITALAATAEMRDPYTAGHQRRVSNLAVAIARRMGLAENDVEGIKIAGIVHDI
ncbi:MAG: PAS domain S-box protein, partial [Rhodospirillaceae bacterium]